MALSLAEIVFLIETFLMHLSPERKDRFLK
jgi:hypothetical protein